MIQNRMWGIWVGALMGLFLIPATAKAHVNLVATLDVAQETPDPVGANPSAGGMATFEYDDETKMLSFTVSVHDLTPPVTASHIHPGAPGQTGPPLFPFDPAATSVTVGPLSEANETALFSGLLYINYHTMQNPNGEIRGQITLVPGACACDAFPNHGQFVKCVKKAIKALEKSERAEVKALKKAAAKSSCGKTKAPKKSIACCLPRDPENNIVTDALCLPVKEAQCAGKGGTSQGTGSTCVPNPCSPSGAFLDGETLF
jgi:CHRD domain